MATNEENGWFGNLRDKSRAASEQFNEDYGTKPGQAGRTARRFVEGWKDAGSKASELGGALVDAGDKYIGQPMARGLQSNIREFERSGEPQTTEQSPAFKSFNDDFVGRNFPEIADKYGSSGVQIELQRNKIGAVEGAVSGAGDAIRELKDQGLSRQQIMDQARNRTKDPQELELVQGELDAAFGGQAPTGPVSDVNIEAVADKVAAARNGADPTNNEMSPEIEAKTQMDEGAIFKQAIDTTSDALHAKHITPQNWYESQSFNSSLIRFGLGLLSGEDYATAFSHAAGDYEKLSGREKRQSYADELVKEGYSQASVMQWIDDGKANILAKPVKQEKWGYKTDATGSYQESSLTGKRDYRPAVDAGVKTQVVQAGDEQILINSKTGEVIKRYEPKPVKAGSGSGSGKGPSEAESKARFGSNRAQAAVNMWNQDYYGKDEDYPLATRTGTFYTGMADESTAKNLYGVTFGEKERAAAGKERAFLAGVLRPESGAAVSNSEWTNYGTIFFDRFGDTPQTKNQKAWMRDMTVQALQRAGGDFEGQDEEKIAKDIIGNMAKMAGQVTEYNPQRGAVKMADGKWYSADFNLR